MSSSDCSPMPPAPPPLPPPPPASEPIQREKTQILPVGFDLDNANPLKLVEDTCLQCWNVFDRPPSDESLRSPYSVLSLYHHCDTVIQSGPTCGLVALMGCLKLVRPDLETTLTGTLERAQSLGYTKLGEMFSVETMNQFIKQVFSVNAERKQWLEKSKLDVVRHLCKGLPILIPYDADANYEPCLKEGKRAHWAMLCGFCIGIHSDSSALLNDKVNFCKVTSLQDNRFLIHVEPQRGNEKDIFHLIENLLPRSRLFVYAKQGKSRRIQIWSFDQLCKSNGNLAIVSSKILNNPERVKMIYPENGDLTKSLANQFLFIYK